MKEAGAFPYLANGGEKGGNGELRRVGCDARRMLLPRNHIYNVKRICKVEEGAEAVPQVPGRRA